MFSSALDTVRIANADQLLMVEAFLMRAALAGTPAVLSPNQAMDSAAIQAIVAGNGHNSKNHFVHAVELGMVRIAIPGGFRSLLDYCLSTINRSLNNPNDEFIFSSLKFLYHKENGKYVYEYEFRMEILRYISMRLTEAKLRRQTAVIPTGLSSDEKKSVERYISVMLQLDKAVQYYEQYAWKKELFPRLFQETLVNRLQMEPPKTALSEFIPIVIRECSKPDKSLYRSYYYRFCEQFAGTFGHDAVREIKEIADVCYNKVAALSMNEQAEVNIAPDFAELASIQASGEDADYSVITSSQTVDSALQKLDWESLVDIYTEVTAISERNGLSWKEAMEKFYARQARLPFVLGGKHALITSVTMAVSAIPIVGQLTNGIVSEFLWNMICDMSEDVMKKPSVAEIVALSKRAKKNIEMMDIIVCTKKGGKK